MTAQELTKGRYVHYCPAYGKKENGRVKSVRGDIAFVVYKCGGHWDNYENYTAASTKISDLQPGWVAEKQETL